MTNTPITAYKGFDKDFACRGFQYEVGKSYEHKGAVEACSSGFHACENPFDVWSYYGPFESKFAVVTLEGETAKERDGDSKIAAAKITIDAELSLGDFTRKCVDWIIAKTKGKEDSNSAQIGSSGDYAQIGSSGYYAQIGSSGNSAQIGSSGDSARIGSSGYSARIEANGENSTIACAAPSKVKAGPGGAICIPYHDGERIRFATGYVGENGIREDVWYIAEDGKLVELTQ